MAELEAQPDYWTNPPVSQKGEPIWAIATLFPNQGEWTEEEYLALETNHLVEFSDGFLDFLPMPDVNHQFLVGRLAILLSNFTRENDLGSVLFAPLPVHLRPGKYREPDIMFFSSRHPHRLKGDYPEGADLVMEIVLDDEAAREHDYKTKRIEYAQADIAEYWIVDPKYHRITVLHLVQDSYEVHGEFEAGDTATSMLLAGFAVAVDDVFAAANED